MKSQYLYFIINLLCLFLPMIASFYSKAPFYKQWREIGVAILLPAIFFLAWDEVFTRLGIWGFNSQYTIGWSLGMLPIEEVLFFLCIPYACLFTYFTFKHLIERKNIFPYYELLSYALIFFLLVAGTYNMDRAYTAVTFLLLSFYLSYLTLKARVRYLGYFYILFAIILIPFLLLNGILTGSFIESEVVWYNDEAIMGIRLGTIPLEDVFYALFLILVNVSVYEWMTKLRTK